MATISKLKVGQTLYDKHKYRAGNTTMMVWGLWTVTVHSIDPDHRWIEASWNSNTIRKYYARDVAKWRVKEPKMPETRF